MTLRHYASMLLMTTALAGAAHAGGDDHFGGNETSAHSDYGGSTGYGSISDRGSSWSGAESFTFDRLSTVDSWTEDTTIYSTYSVDGFSGDAELVSVSYDTGFATYRVRDETVRLGSRLERVPISRPAPAPVAAAPAPAPVAPAPAPAPEPAPQVDMGPINAPPLAYEAPAPAPEPMLEPAPMPGPQLDIVPSGPVKNDPRSKLDRVLRELGRINVHTRTGALTKAEKRLASALNMGAGAVSGAIAAGKGMLSGGGKVMTPKGAVEGAILGAAVARAKEQLQGKTPFDQIARDLTTVTPDEVARAQQAVRDLPERERERIVDRFDRFDRPRGQLAERQRDNRNRNGRGGRNN